MENLTQLYLTPEYIISRMTTLFIAVMLVVSLKYISAVICSVDARHELAEKDNPAFGISIAGVALAITIMITGVVGSNARSGFLSSHDMVLAYGVLGVILMSVTRFVFDRISMPTFSIKSEVLEGNIAAAILDAGNVIATAIIIRAIMVWVESDTIYGLFVILIGYFISQVMLSLASLYKIMQFNWHHPGTLWESIEDGNIALAWKFIGHRLGVALAITAASSFVPYVTDSLNIVVFWVILSLLFMILVAILEVGIEFILLYGIDVDDEVNNQKNIAIGIIQAVITVAIGVMMVSLTG